MRSQYSQSHPLPLSRHQHGAALMIMLIIVIIGSMAYLVSTLSKVTLNIERNKQSSGQLAQSKEILLGYAANGAGGYPGNMLAPDALSSSETPPKNYDGTYNTGCLDASNPTSFTLTTTVSDMRCLGRLPWKTLKMFIDGTPSENDPSGLMPWYAVSVNLLDPTGAPFNSELLNTDNTLHPPNNYPLPPHPWLTVRGMNGNVLSDRVAFVVIIPGPALPGQSRPSSPSLGGANQYLDEISFPAGCSPTTTPCTITYKNSGLSDEFIMGEEHRWIDDPANPGKQIEDSTYHFNDKVLYITIDELMPLIEMRIAREAKKCLDDYAAMPVTTNGNLPGSKYPWSAPTNDITYTGTYNTLFGRIPNQPNINISATPSPTAVTLTNSLTALQIALDNYFAIGNAANQTALINAGNYVISLKDSIPSISTTINTAGLWGKQFASGSHTYSGVSGKITTAQTAVANNSYPTDTTMSATWPASCTLLTTATYWADWKKLVFYQISDGYKPGSLSTCSTSCLSVSGSGNANAGSGSYRASIIMAGKKLGLQTRATQSVTEYLELGNQTAPVNLTFSTYKPTDTNYSTVNDLVLCLDGKNNCK